MADTLPGDPAIVRGQVKWADVRTAAYCLWIAACVAVAVVLFTHLRDDRDAQARRATTAETKYQGVVTDITENCISYPDGSGVCGPGTFTGTGK